MQKTEVIPQNDPVPTTSGVRVDKEHILALMTSNQYKTSETQANPAKPVLIEPRIDILFSRLGAIYGQHWWNNFRTESLLLLAKKEWSEALERFNNQIMKEVLELYRDKKIYAPSLPQFVECCKSAQARRIPRALREELSKPSTLEVAQKHISVMKTILKINKNTGVKSC